MILKLKIIIFYSKAVQNGNSNADNDNEESNDPTPSYNFDILSDLTSRENTEYLKEKLGTSKTVSETIKFLKLWLMKRELNTVTFYFRISVDCFGVYIIILMNLGKWQF
jgi:hypothetical protein